MKRMCESDRSAEDLEKDPSSLGLRFATPGFEKDSTLEPCSDQPLWGAAGLLINRVCIFSLLSTSLFAQTITGTATVTGPEAKMAFAKFLFDREYGDLTETSSSVAGVVVIFDSEDGGMIAATMPALRQWKAGTLSDQAFWHRCFFDPREAFGLAANP